MKSHIQIVAMFVIALTFFATTAGLKTEHDKREAESLISDAEELSAKSTPTALQDFLLKHRSSLVRDKNCNQLKCSYTAEMSNYFLVALHLAPWSKVAVEVTTQQQQVTDVFVAVETIIAGMQSGAIVLSLGPSMCGAGCENIDLDGTKDISSGKPKFSYIKLGPSATPAQRKLAFQISADCIFTIRGCTTLSAISGESGGPGGPGF